MTVKKKVKSHSDVIDYLKDLPFYNKYIKKRKIKRLKNIDLLFELPFLEKLNIIKTNHAVREYAMSYKVKLVEKKDPIEQLEASKSSINDKRMRDRIMKQKYQITLKVVFKNAKALKLNLLQFISIQQQKR